MVVPTRHSATAGQNADGGFTRGPVTKPVGRCDWPSAQHSDMMRTAANCRSVSQTRQGTVESGHALHGLNAIYLDGIGWFRVDPRGNKPGIDSQFSMSEEKLAYLIRPELGEVDYPDVLVAPLKEVIEAMRSSGNTQELFYKRPESMTLK